MTSSQPNMKKEVRDELRTIKRRLRAITSERAAEKRTIERDIANLKREHARVERSHTSEYRQLDKRRAILEGRLS